MGTAERATGGVATELRLLGPVELWRGGSAVRLGGRKQRAVLALIAVEAPRLVPAATLIEELWGEAPPPGAEKTLRSYVSRLRALLRPTQIVSRSRGYALELDGSDLDVVRFEEHVRAGREALGRGAARLAADQLRASLELWRGPALADVADEGLLRREAERLEDLRRLAQQDLIEAELALGLHRELVGQLECLVREHPLDERFWRQLVLALYRSGRQADALAAYERARELLADELGLELGAEMKRLQRSVLRHDVPPAPADDRHNLPAQLTTLIGRERELDEIEGLLLENRLVTLVGTGGAGKTRLALAAAERAVGALRDGVWLVELSALADASLVADEVAAALSDRRRGGEDLVEQLRSSELLFVLDNCEHLLAGCRELVGTVLRRCPRVSFLATSREALGVPGEVEFPVRPLAVPAADADAAAVARSPAGRLFLDRVPAPDRALGNGDGAAAVARICRELDGLPLAIELAAARTRELSPSEIAARLDDRFRLLRDRRGVGAARHQTLKATLDWSYALLTESERALLRRVSVFAGGFTLEAAAAVSRDDAERVLELVARLIDTSLVLAEHDQGGTRYGLLETVRAYARSRLAESGEEEELTRRHAEHFAALAEEAEPAFEGGAGHATWLARLEQEHDNVRAALDWCVRARERELELRLAGATRRFWFNAGYWTEGRRRLEAALSRADGLAPTLRLKVIRGAAVLALAQRDHVRGAELAEQQLSLGRELGDDGATLGGLNNLAAAAELRGDPDAARVLYEEAREFARARDDLYGIALTTNNLGHLARDERDYERARELFVENLALCRRLDDDIETAYALCSLAEVALRQRAPREAAPWLEEAVRLVDRANAPRAASRALMLCAALAVSAGEARRAARLAGAAEALAAAGAPIWRPGFDVAAEVSRALEEELEPDELQLERAAGASMTLSEAVAYALKGTQAGETP